ncbi:MAG: metalloregulator ArsR/SmtB family transcription factor [bacterium]
MHVLQALGDPVRRALIGHLAGGEVTAGVLAQKAGAEFGIGVSAVSQHLAVLKAAGLAAARARGRERLYRLRPEGFQAVQLWLDHHRPFWSEALDRLGEELDHDS